MPWVFEEHLTSEDDCRDYLYEIRWPLGLICPRCGKKPWETGRNRLKCSCGMTTSLTAGTAFHGKHVKLLPYFRAIWCVLCNRDTQSILLQPIMEAQNYKTAMYSLPELKEIVNCALLEKLDGQIEVGKYPYRLNETVDETDYVITVAVELAESRPRRVRASIMNETYAKSTSAFVRDSIAPGNTVFTQKQNIKGYNCEHNSERNEVKAVATQLRNYLQKRNIRTDYKLQKSILEFVALFNREGDFYFVLKKAVQTGPK